jgi:hypothetical protein
MEAELLKDQAAGVNQLGIAGEDEQGSGAGIDGLGRPGFEMRVWR